MRIRRAATAAQIRSQNRELNGRISRYERRHKRLTDDDRLTQKPVTTKPYPRNVFSHDESASSPEWKKGQKNLLFATAKIAGYGAAEAVSRFAFTLAI